MEESGNLDYSLTMSGELGSMTPKANKPATPASEASKALLAAAASFNEDDPARTPKNSLAQATKELEKKKTPGSGNISQALKKAAGVVDREERVEVIDLTRKAAKMTPKKGLSSPTRGKNMASSGTKKVLGSSSRSNDGAPSALKPKPSRRNPPPPRKTLSSSANNPFATVSKSSGEFANLSKSQQVEFRNLSSTAQEYLYGFGAPKTRKSKENKAERSKSLRSSWERLSKSEDTGKKASKKAHGSYSDLKNCTFKPKITKWKGGEQKEEEEGDNQIDEQKRLLLFVKKQDASTRSDRREKEHKIKKRDYELRLDRLQCRSCGNFQSYDEFVEKRTKCPADFCSHGEYYQPQVVFKRDVLKGLKKLIKQAYLEEGEVDEDVVTTIRDKMRGLEPSEKAIVERLMREENERNMTEDQIREREEKMKFDKEKKESDAKKEKELRKKMIEMAIEEKEKELEERMHGEYEKRGVSMRKVYDKEMGKVITVEYHYDQPINKVLPAMVEVEDPTTGETIEVEVMEKVPFYDDGLKRYWDGPSSLLDEGEAYFTKEEFFERLDDDSSKRKIKANAAADKNLGKLGTIFRARGVKSQLEREAEVNEKLAEAVEARDLMQIRRCIHEAGTLHTPLNSEELRLAIKTERDLCEEHSLLKEGKEAVKKEDMDGVNDWLKKVKSRQRKKLEGIKFKLKRLEKTEKHIEETKSGDPKFQEWMESLTTRREVLEREKDAVTASEEKNEEVAVMREKLEGDKDILDRLKSAMREKNLEDVTAVLGEALDAGLHLLSENSARADGNFFSRLEKDVARLHERLWEGGRVVKRHEGGVDSEDRYDIEFEDGVVLVRVKRSVLRKWKGRAGGGDEGDEEEDEDEEEEEEEDEDEEGKEGDMYKKPKKSVFAVGVKVLARRPEQNPGPTKYTVFRAEDPRCGPVILKKLDRRLRAIGSYLDGHPSDKRSPLTPLLYAYARQRREVLEMMEHSNLKWEEEKGEGKDGDGDSDEDDADME